MIDTFTQKETFEVISCGHCNVRFAVLADTVADWRNTGKWFWCPNGHNIHYSETALQRTQKAAARAQELLEQERRRAENLRQQRDHAERSAAIVKGQARALKKRIKAGVCPCCHRNFGNLREHMANQHPTFAVDEQGK